MDLPSILILGRPNVGKSTLINRLLKKRTTITLDLPGVTRDLNQFLLEWQGIPFIIQDSGGIFLSKSVDYAFQDQVEDLVQNAFKQASKVLFIVDYKEGVLPVDEKIAELLRDRPEKVIFVVNKVDDDHHKQHLADFYRLGFGEPLPISSLHGHGIPKLMSRMIKGFKASTRVIEKDQILKVALVGRTNVGKSSLLNKIFDDDKVIVSETAGTTRDAVHFYYTHDERVYDFIDTAGVRKLAKLKKKVDYYSLV